MIIPMWALLALIAAVSWSALNVIDKILISNHMSYQQILMTGPFEMLMLLPFLFFFKISMPLSLVPVVFVASLVAFLSIVAYYEGLKLGEVSRLAPLFTLSPMFVAVLSAIFLSEIFAPIKYFGIFLLILGGMLISFEHSAKKKFNLKAVLLFILSMVLFAVFAVTTKVILPQTTPFSIFFVSAIFMRIFFPAYYWATQDRADFFRKIWHWKPAVLLFVSIILVISSYLLHIYAISIGFVTLVSALEEVQAFFVLVIVSLLAHFSKTTLRESFSWVTFTQKVIAVCLMFGGVILIL